MFRCPSCAKVWKLPLQHDLCLFMNKDLNKITIEYQPIRWSGPYKVIEDLEHLADTMVQDNNLQFIDADNIPCPTCGNIHSFVKWNEAWNTPGDFFDGDQLCSCGGEMWFEKVPGSNRYALACEDCGWEKPKVRISGGEGTLVTN